MPLTFYPGISTAHPGSLSDRIEVLMDAAEKYKAAIVDNQGKPLTKDGEPLAPKDHRFAFNWEEIATVLRKIREMPEVNKEDREKKAMYLTRLAEIYEILRAARMSKLEAVRLALITEANQLKSGSSSQVA